jgi:peptidylprolyl isomerase
MQQAAIGDRVTVHFIGTLDNGRIFDQRDEDQPLTFTLGNQEIFEALEQEIIGMSVGSVKNIFLPKEQAYGVRLEENLLKVSRDMFPADRELCVGQKLSVEMGSNEKRLMRIRNFDEQEVLLDGNHDLAGCDLTFALQLVGIG